jgi:NhaP-type Na+/H+ and K+/H+ antiporter
MELVGRIFAGLGAAAILFALTFVSILVGILVHGMLIIMAGPLIDAFFKKKGEEVFVPGSIK